MLRITRIGRAPIALAAGWAAAVIAWAAAGTSRAAEPRPTGVVYVQSNIAATPPGNGIFAFKQHPDGSLAPLTGSPFPTGGAGIAPSFALGPYDSDQELIADPGHRHLFAVNGGSDTIAVFKLNADGSPARVAGSPFPSGGSNPVSVGLAGDVLAVVNKDMDPDHPGVDLPDYATFRVAPGGQLSREPISREFVDLGSSPTQALIAPGHRLLFGADFLGGILRSYHLTARGVLRPADAVELPPGEFAGTGMPPLPLGLQVHPTRPLLYVGFVTINRLGVYRYDRAGRLIFLRTVANSGMGLCWVLVNKDGSRIYTSNTADNSISVYDAEANPAEPAEIQKVALKGMANAYQIALDPTGKFFYVVTQRNSATLPASANALHVLTVDGDGKLTEVDSSPTVLPVPEGTRPQGVIAF